MSAGALTLLTIPEPLATGARSAGYREGDCAICGHQLGRGHRVADLPDNSPAHISCIATTNTPRSTA
jgi:hypothetical protein